MRVIVISAAFPPLRAGESDYVLWLCERLAERYESVELVTSEGAGPRPTLNGVRVTPLLRDWTWRDMPRLLSHLRQQRPDVVLLPYLGWVYGRHPMVSFLPAALRQLLPSTRFYTLFFNTDGTAQPTTSLATVALKGIFDVASRLRFKAKPEPASHCGPLLEHSDGLLVFSEAHRDWFAQAHPPAASRIHVLPSSPLVHPIADAQDARREGRRHAQVDDAQFLFVNFGYVDPGKGIDVLLQAFARVAAAHPQARLAVVGGTLDASCSGWSTYGECLRHLAWALRIDDKVRWIGGYETRSALASQCLFAGDAAVLPFDVGIALNKTSAAAAAWHGLPLVSTAGERLESAFVADRNALLSPPRNVEGLVVSMRRVIEDRPLAGRLRDGALDLAKRWFSPERAVEALDGLLRTERHKEKRR